MAITTQIVVTEPLLGNWIKDSKDCQFDLKIDDANTLRLIFPDQKIGDLIYALQRLQSLALEQRKKIGLPPIATAHAKDINKIEYGIDHINEIATLMIHYSDGTVRDTPLEKEWLNQVSQFLTAALQRFENQSQSQKH